MSSITGNWMIALGAITAFLGLCLMPAAMGEHADATLLTLGACALSFGSLVASVGVYVKARALQPAARGRSAAESRNPVRRVRGGCDICHGDTPVTHCKVHQLHLCPDCQGQHYDPRSCVYAPSTRRQTMKTAKGMAAKARA
jgi:hypothetical protein